MATIAVAAGAVCVPLHPGFAADEWRRYFGDLRVAALLTRADVDSASRGVAYSLGIPVIDLSPRSRRGARRIQPCLPGSATLPSSARLAAGADDAFILLTSGTHVAAEAGPSDATPASVGRPIMSARPWRLNLRTDC